MTEQTQQRVEDWLSTSYRDLPKSSERLGDLRRRLDETGVAELEDFLTPEAHDLLKRQILDLESAAASSELSGHKKFALKGEQLQNTVVDGLARSSYMLELANGLLRLDEPIAQGEIVPGINIMRGPGDMTAYHFDGTYLNMILPVVVPNLEGPRRGQLILYPNVRSFKKSFWDRKVVPRSCASRHCGECGSAARSITRSAAHISSTGTAPTTASSRRPSPAFALSRT